jgi:hypothetical protein
VRPPPATEQNAAAAAGAERAPGHNLATRQKPQWNPDPRLRRNRTRQERNMIKEPQVAAQTAALCVAGGLALRS